MNMGGGHCNKLSSHPHPEAPAIAGGRQVSHAGPAPLLLPGIAGQRRGRWRGT